MKHPLTVRVNREFVLNAGWWEEKTDGEGQPIRIVHPPRITMFWQVVDYLETAEFDAKNIDVDEWGLAAAAVAVCVRWGSYFAVLADHAKPLWEKSADFETSLIGEEEMARINIEASAGMAEWIEIMRNDEKRHALLVLAALALLKMPKTPKIPKKMKNTIVSIFWLMVRPTDSYKSYLEQRLKDKFGRAAYKKGRQFPTRVLANLLINACYRNNNPVEDLHAGVGEQRPLLKRRMDPKQVRDVIGTTVGLMSLASAPLFALVYENKEKAWSEKIMPFALDPILLLPPTRWSLTAQTRTVRLRGAENDAG